MRPARREGIRSDVHCCAEAWYQIAGSDHKCRPPAVHKLDPYTAIIDSRLEEFPGLSAKRLCDEVRAARYPGGYTPVRDYVRAVRPR